MEAVQKNKSSQCKKKNKRSKSKSEEPEEEEEEALLENQLECLSKELNNITVSADNAHSLLASEMSDVIQEALKDSSDETVGLLDDESKDNLDVSDIKWLDSGQLRKELIESQVSSYLQKPNKSPDSGLSASDTELDEIKSLPSHSTITDFQVDTKFESPQRVAKSLSIEHVEEFPDRLEQEPIGSIDDIMFEIASEVSPSAPILDSVFSQDLENKNELVEEAEMIESYFTPLSFLIQEEETIKPYTFSQLTSLYYNSELEENVEFIDYFVESELRGGEVTRHPLYEILVGYLRARGKLAANVMELETLKNDCREHQAKLWTLQKQFVIKNGECQDGNPVEASHEFQVSHFDKASATKLSRSLSAIKDLVNESYALNAYTCEVLKLQVEHYIQNISAEFSFLPHNAPINLVSDGLPAFSNHTGRDLRIVISDLRLAISVLFSFQRRPIKDIGFIADTRQWLSKLVAVMLRVATWRDHMFILNHVLRCPSGVSHWATNFIQPPPCPFNSPFSNEHLNHLVTTLATILLPVKKRDQFLSNYGSTVLATECKVPVGMECTVTLTSETDALWVMVDSEGEDEVEEKDEYNLKENDIVALLNQIPFDVIYRQVLQITRRDDQDFYDAHMISDHHVLRLMAFCSILIDLLEKGLSNHSSIRYKQFAKRLGRLVRHTTQYATDQWQAFRNYKIGTDPAMIERLQVEYDALVMRAARCLYNTPGHTTWQFLAVLPFSCVTLRTLWKLFCLLLQGDDEPIDEARWQERLEERLSELSDADTYYLLTTVATMAMARTQEDFLFIKAATLQLLEIGFLNLTTREHCSKSARIMLANLSTKHPALISVLLEKLHVSSQVGKLVLYLVKELPVGVWKPTDSDLTILEDWLSCPIISIRNNVARYLITHLNWGFVSTEGQGNVLFLPQSVHIRVAMMIVKVAIMFCPSSPVSSGSITDSVKQMSSLASSMVRPNSSEQALIVWLWQTAYKLHLHLMDQSDIDIKHSLSNPLTAFTAIPDLETGSEELEALGDGVQKQQVMAVYFCLQLTTIGHNVPLICTKGFSLVSLLQSYHLHTAVISLLQNMIPLFLDCPESLTTNEKFSSLLTTLLGADRTYFKVAKSLIAPDFPGHILAQFGNMVQYHLVNYNRYCLVSPAPIVDIWMKCLCNIWKDEPTSAGYIMDIIISTAFFQPNVSSIAYDNIAILLQSVSLNSQTNSRLSSLFSWISIGGSGTVVSLVPQGSSCPYTPWFAYFALQVEEIQVQGSNGLWKEVLKELASVGGKPSVDSAVKRASATVKIPPPPSSALSIYRWSQQALDTPVDHPVLPLLWQRFFMLYFTKVPSVSGVPDRGSVGSKFFEGMSNITYTKKLKRKLFDCSEYYSTKTESSGQQVSQDRQALFANLAKLYRTLSLWLEEPKLQEPGLYFPALPPQYNPIRLASIVNGDQGPWYEFIDYENVLNSHQSKVEAWMQALGRSEGTAKPTVLQSQEENDPFQRIIKRLETYDSPLPPPMLRPYQPIVPSVTRDALLYKGVMLDSLKDSFKSLLDFAQIYYLRTSEHTALDCAFLELVPTLFVNSENQVKLLAACDTIDPDARSMTPPPANALNCAGPAVIYITVCSARENEGVSHQIQLNRVEMEGLLKRSLQPPLTSVCVASIYIEHLTQALERECLELKRIGDVQMLSSVREVGIILFYHISSMFNDEAMSYPPIKQLFTSCIEILGQAFISGETNQCVRLLTEVFQNPRIAGLLCPHFTPSSADAATFLSLYSNVVDMEESAPMDLLFVLLTKFDVSQWLLMKRPRLVERSQLIELVGKALAMAGQTPPDEKLMLQEVYRRHLSTLFLYDFPEHYGEVLNLALRYSETQTLAAGIWFDIVNSLARARFRPGMSLGQIKEEIHRYATEQKALSLQELRDTALLFGNHFTKERLQYGLYGLYPKYRMYIEPLTTLLGMVGHALIVTTLQNDRGTLSDKLCEQLWPNLSGLFSPWLAPYFTRHLAEPTAAWIQQLTEDRSVLPPWIVADGGHAHKMAAMFAETIRFILDTLPACSNILSFLWQFYVTNFAHSSIKDHILNVMHNNLLTLPWQRFFPTLQDLDFMLKVVDQYLPDCHTFLGAIFIEVSWNSWVANICANCPIQVATKTHGALLHLLIKLANEPNVRQSPKITPLLLESQQFSWHLIECNNYESVANWFVMSYDPRVILQLTKEDWSGIDMAALDLLQVAGGFTSTANNYHPTTPRKRQVYIRATVKLLLSCLSKYKPLATSRQEEVKNAICKMVEKVEIVVSATAPGAQKASEAGLLMVEILTLVNQPTNSPVSDIARDAILSWLSTRSSSSVVVAALLRSLGTSVANQEILGTLLEAALTAFFRRGVGESLTSAPNWSIVLSVLQPIVPRHPPLEESLVSCGHLLSLYALVLKNLPSTCDVREEAIVLHNLTEWISNIKVNQSMESKLPLLWSKVLYLSHRQCEFSTDNTTAVRYLQKLVHAVTQNAEHRAGAGWGLLGAIGICKTQTITNKCRFLIRVLAALVLAQLPVKREDNSEQSGQFVRTKPHSSGSIISMNGDYHPSAEALKALSTLEGLTADKNYAELKSASDFALKLIRQPENSLHNADQVFINITLQIYNDNFLHALTPTQVS